jgi:hypothetical protein
MLVERAVEVVDRKGGAVAVLHVAVVVAGAKAEAEAEAAPTNVLLQIYLAFLSLGMLVDPSGKQDAVDSNSIVSDTRASFHGA